MKKTFKILSMSGGGFRGLYSAYILYCIEERLGVNLFESFDMIAGTSTGSISAAGVAAEKPFVEALDLYRKQDSFIFPEKWWPPLGPKSLKSAMSSLYDLEYLREALKTVFGDDELFSEIKKPLLIPTTDVGNGSIHILRSNYSDSLTQEHDRNRDMRLVDAVLASCAAPTYFDPQHRIEPYLLADGGLWASDPSLLAVTEARNNFGIEYDDIAILSYWNRKLQSGLRQSHFSQVGMV